MQILLDVTRIIRRYIAGNQPTGIDRVLISYLLHYHPKCNLVIGIFGKYKLLSEKSASILIQEISKRKKSLSLKSLLKIVLLELLTLRRKIPLSGSILLNIGHSGLEHASYRNWIDRHELNLVAMIHDVIPITHPQFCREGEDMRHGKRLETICLKGKGIIFNSEFTQESFIKNTEYRPNLKIKSIVSHLPPANLENSNTKRLLTSHYFVMLGTIEARKNHWLILQVWQDLIRHMGNNCPKLVIIGKRGWECSRVLNLLDQTLHLNGSIIELNNCSDQELAHWLQFSQALLFPSFVEGYGLPMVEALMHGTPVIASKLSVFKEIAKDIPLYLNPNSSAEWYQAIKSYNNTFDPDRQRQILQMNTYKGPTWDEYFKKIDYFLECSL